MPKLTAEEQSRELERSSPLGYFNYAESYRAAACALNKMELRVTHRDTPIRFLYYHGIELYLKAHLRAHDIPPWDLSDSKRYGHHIEKLSKKSAELGLVFMDEDEAVFSQMTQSDAVIRSRYFSSGFFSWPQIDALDRTCKSLRESVGAELKAKGHRVRI